MKVKFKLSVEEMNAIEESFEEYKSLLSDSPLHQILSYCCRRQRELILIREHNLVVDRSHLREEEIDILRRNWNRFCDKFNLDDNRKVQLLGFFTYTNRYTMADKISFKRFLRKKNYFLRLAKDLPNRQIRQLVDCARNRFCPLRRSKDLTDEDRQQIKDLYLKYERKWTKIANEVNCHPKSVTSEVVNNYDSSGQSYRKGMWSKDEDQKLIEALKTSLNTNHLSKYIFNKNIDFQKVIQLSDISRSGQQCQSHWESLKWKIPKFDPLFKWSTSDTSKLIYCLFRCIDTFDTESDIDWTFVSKKFPNIPIDSLMNNWSVIKSMVPKYKKKTYPQILEFLFDNFLPTFVTNVEKLQELEDFYHY